ncbi:MAG: DUF1016 N-terminal domain-containing protein, partial [Betaproteobacteria bacterium]
MATPPIPQDDFTEITQLIAAARQRAVQAVNNALVELYWQVGQTISHQIKAMMGVCQPLLFLRMNWERAA